MGRTYVRVQRLRTSYRFRAPHSARVGSRGLFAAAVFTVALILGGAAAVVAGGDSATSENVGFCHATGSERQPYVYMVVARGSDDERAHRDHAQDIPEVSGPEDCPQATSSAGGMPECHHENATTPAPEPNRCDADVAASLEGTLENGTARFSATVNSLGPGEADNVRLTVELPDVGEAWTLEGANADRCTLDATTVSCKFGDLHAGDARDVAASAERCPTDCGDDLEANAQAKAHNDRNAANDAATSAVVVPDCPEDDEPATEPTTTPPAPDNGSDANATEPPANTTEPPAEDDNASEPEDNTSAPEPAPAPQPGDVALRVVNAQDDEQATVTFRVKEAGNGSVQNVTLHAELPDARRAWLLGGADAGDCSLEGRTLTCWFGDVPANGERVVELRAYTDRMPCGDHRTGSAWITADDDSHAANNRGSPAVAARSC